MDDLGALFLGALGGGFVGTVLTKLIDVTLVETAARKSERVRWLREQRLRAYTNVAKELLSLGLEARSDLNPLKGNALAAESILLINNKALAKRLLAFSDSLQSLRSTSSQPDKKAHEESFNKLREEAISIVNALKAELLE